MSSTEHVVVTPEWGKTTEVGRALFAVAKERSDVTSTSDGPLGFAYVVPVELYERYRAAQGTPVPVAAPEPAPEAAQDPAPAPKRRGRPPKNPVQE